MIAARLLPSGLWQHPGGDPVVPDGAAAEARLSGRLLQPGALPADRLRLDRLRRAHEEAHLDRGRPAGAKPVAVGAPAPQQVGFRGYS